MLKDFFNSLIEQYGNIGLFIGLALEFIGLPVPGVTMMSFYGYLTRTYNSFIIIPILFSTAGTLFGSLVAYVLGFKYGETVVLKFGKYIFITPEKLKKTEKLFEKYRVILLLFSRYVPGVRHIVPYLGGMSRIKPINFFVLNLIGSVIWCSSFIGLGYFVGENWDNIVSIDKMNYLVLALLIIFVFLVLRFFNKHKITIFLISFPLLIFIKLTENLIREQLSVFDNTIYNFITKLIPESLKPIMIFISFIGSAPFLIGITAFTYLYFRKHQNYLNYWCFIALNLAASSIITEIFKNLFRRERPDLLRLVEVTGYSFPSGHSMIGMSFFGFLVYLFIINLNHFKKYLIAVMLSLLIVFIGISRVYLHVHYASDVVAGFSVGLAWLVIYITLVNRFTAFGNKNNTELKT